MFSAPLLTSAESGRSLIHRALAYAVPFAPPPPPDLLAGVDRWGVTALHDGQHEEALPELQRYLRALLALRADSPLPPGTLDSLRAATPSDGPGLSLAQTLTAYAAWQQDRPDEVLTALDQRNEALPFHQRQASPLSEQILQRYLRAEALFAQARYEEALPWYTALPRRGLPAAR